MTTYAPSDMTAITIPADGGRGCGQTHRRGPEQPWGVDCAPCEAWLRANDNRWSATIAGITETYDEKLGREQYAVKGVREKDALLTAAIARLAGYGQAQLPASLTRMIAGIPAHVPGLMLCPSGHENQPGQKFCGECAAPMSSAAPAASLMAGAAA